MYARWLVQEKKIPVTNPTLEFTFKTDDLRGQLKAFSYQKLADEECFAKTVELTEALSNKEIEDIRAQAWATGDLVIRRPAHSVANYANATRTHLLQ